MSSHSQSTSTFPSPSSSSSSSSSTSPPPVPHHILLDDLYLDDSPNRAQLLDILDHFPDVMPDQKATVNSNADVGNASPLSRRPSLSLRQTSYSKRHASFDTPREIPLPRMVPPPIPPVNHSAAPNSDSDTPQILATKQPPTNGCCSDSTSSGDRSSALPISTSISSVKSPDLAKLESRFDHHRDMNRDRDLGYELPDSASRSQPGSSSAVLPNSRPFSMPDSKSIPQSLYDPQPIPPNRAPDRSSTFSLPLLTSVPYHTLPTIPATTFEETLDSGSGIDSNLEAGPSTRLSPPPMARPMFSSWTDPGTGQSDPTLISRSLSSPYDSLDGSFSMPPPEPPTIITPPLPSEPRPGAPHEPFLSHGPPPKDVWIAIETCQSDYRLVVRLPEFNRQSITIAMRKRRILHIVADKWEAGGGHFERRVSFGYDADLAQVRAEFDGEYLVICVPRRLPPSYMTNPKPRLH